ncbi:uncharacterized protein CTRU02_212023 [Colletotrichum truncatum]|uniref:Uncharacterized protein n=1 Tax=Colletotrichum truncatum TaxID=5467 RepID=A0ACC3YMC7_COLTU|nr:uncharacterized protein CTRU02_06905 [Colletotrichum truncatum]KAF6792288.1 hypothetical protein CTRU02_06905 [Colletotrichum truncatum]
MQLTLTRYGRVTKRDPCKHLMLLLLYCRPLPSTLLAFEVETNPSSNPTILSKPVRIMLPNTGLKGMAQYARNVSPESSLRNRNANLTMDQMGQQHSDALPAPPTRQEVVESATLPAPKPFPPARTHAIHFHQAHQSGLPQHLPSSIRNPPNANAPDASPSRQQHRRHRANSQSSDATGFWPESQIDSQFGSPTTQHSERDHKVNDSRIRSPAPTFDNVQTRTTDDKLPYTINRDGSIRVTTSKNGSGLPITSIDAPVAQQDAYSSEPIYSSPKRHLRLAFHPTTVRSYAPPAYDADQEVFSDSPMYQTSSHGLRRVKKDGKSQEFRRVTPLPDKDIEGSLASDYPISEDDHGTPRANRKTALSRGPALWESSLPPVSYSQVDKAGKRRRESCDYADNELAGMTYSQLRQQPFDDDPAKKPLQAAGPLTGDSLPVKLDHFKSQREVDQKEFFMQMTVSDWERSGDWFLEQFGQVAQKLKEARQNKRATVENFESEIASREEAVRLRTENINKKLSQIKHKGEDMLADKEI